ncbi:TPA: trp operon leader peptide [Enterobacter hormaechei]|nr:hypothetical protein AM401_05215 [Enterobacter cloacae complex sp.]AXO47587.1 trp operon leader peptide [Enterobacter hormaechei]MBT1793663.1 trp operon leader peptide [Enterobacter hormaechei subsp. xiangfangensis]MVX94790.1 trp operon leader peptide [Enterobacteriaceae bacterium 8376wB9]HAV1801778.1 trp operon leader peptide [Enterobacter hormaechei subsp. steigerwaltii]
MTAHFALRGWWRTS